MKDLDQELADAVNQVESTEAADGGVAAPAQPVAAEPKSHPRRNLGLLVALLVVGGGVLALMFSSAGDASIYAIKVDELVAQKSKFEDRTVRAQGFLVKGSLLKRDNPCEYRFKLHAEGAELPVRYQNCVVPDTFRDVPNIDVEVTAEGKLASAEGGYLEASHIMAKCPSKYEMQQKQAAGEQVPHSLGASAPALPAAYGEK
jgi:cytochrome c-type biogenesis protein CcmE